MNQGKELDDGKAEFIVYSTMNQPENYKIVAILKTVPFYYVVKKGNTELLNEMNSGMEQMIIEAPDIVNSVNYNLLKLQNDLAYTEDENEFISSKKIVKIGFYKDTAPLAEVKENGEYSGIYIDVINHIKDSTGLNIEMYPIDRSEYAYDLIRNGTIDFLIGSSDSALDASDNTDVIGTHSFMDYNTVTVTNQDYQFDKDRNTTFALTSARRYWESFIYANFNYAKIEYYESAKDCLEAVRKGEADATLLNTIEYNYQSKNARFEKLIEWEAYRSKSQTVFVTSVTSDENLLSIINKACDRLSTEESQNIIYYHLNTPYHSYNVSDKLYNYRGFIIFIFAVSIVLVISISIIHRNRRNSLMILKEKNTQLEKASAAKTDFMSNMSHEIRTPMNAIIGMTKLAEDEVDDIKQGKKDEIIQLKEYLNDIDSSSQYLLGVLNDILDMSRIEGGKLVLTEEWVMPTEITSSCINMVKPLMEKKNINFFYPDSIMELCSYECFVDVQKSKQMLLNILNNACKFTSAKGTISIKCENEKLDIVAGTATDKIIISDTGCGMSEDFLKKIFTPFEQERNVYTGSIQGTGLGLSLARSIARAEGGDITVESELGKGSTFTIHFPYKFRLIQESEKTVISHSEILRGNLNGKHILLAEDNKLNATIATRLLEKYGAKVTWVEDGKLAISEIENNPEDTFDIILMDIRMPNMDGLEATKKIRSLNRKDARNIPIVAMTANAFEEDRRSSLEAGMNAHLTKPINPEELFQTISKFVK